LSSDSTDDFPSDNQVTDSWEVTEKLYAWDDDNITTGWSYNNAQNYSILSRYEFNTTDTVKSILINFFSSTGFETLDGSVVEVGMWPVVDGSNNPSTIATDGDVDYFSPVGGGSLFHTISTSEFNQTISIDYSSPVQVTPGEYMVGFRVQSGQVRTSSTDQEPAPLQAFVDVNNDGIDGWISFVPIIRIETYSATTCNNTDITVLATVTCDEANDEIDIETAVSTTGSSTVYDYIWSTGATTADISVNAYTTYSVTVTDENLCTGTGSWVIDENNPADCDIQTQDTLTVVIDGITYYIVVATGDTFTVVNGIEYQFVLYLGDTIYINGTDTFQYYFGDFVPYGIDDLSKATAMKVYPNPASNDITIASSIFNNDCQVSIYNMTGHLVYTENTGGIRNGARRVNISGLSNGLYNIVVSDGSETIKQTISVAH
jgi:hypothetical protein